MLQSELAASLLHHADLVRDTERRVRDAGPSEKSTRVRMAAVARRRAYEALTDACGVLQAWPCEDRVGHDGVEAAMAILSACQGAQIRALLPLLKHAVDNKHLSSIYLAEATDRLCAAEQRPQVYGTISGYPVADAARLDAQRIKVGLPPINPVVKAAAVPSPDPAPSLRQLPDELSSLRGLLTDLPPVPYMPRVQRPTVGSNDAWGCAYCCGQAPPGSTELDIKGKVWRICVLCEGVADTSHSRLLDVLLTVGGVSEQVARATADAASQQGWRVPLRYEGVRARPNHRPQPRWANMPPGAVAKLVAGAEQFRSSNTQVSTAPSSPPRYVEPAEEVPLRAPSPENAKAAPDASAVWDGQTWRSSLLTNKRAREVLRWPLGTPLSRLQVVQALQVGEGNLDSNGLVIHTVADLAETFARPPVWLQAFHDERARERAANHALQTGATSTAASARNSVAQADVPPPRHELEQDSMPHPDMLISPRAHVVLAKPPTEPLKPGQVAKLLQVAFTTMQKNALTVTTVSDLAAVFHAPPSWLIAFHRKLAHERAANSVRA